MFDRFADGLRAEFAQVRAALGHEDYNAKSSYSHWGFQSVHTELTDAPVTVSRGTLPADLDGVYIRNGTNPQFPTKGVRYQMFDGPGMLHQIRIGGGTASYTNRYVRTKRFEFERAAGHEVFLSMGELLSGGPAARGKLEWLQQRFREGSLPDLKFSGTGNGTAIQFHAGRLYAFNEAGYPFALDARVEEGRLRVEGTGWHESWDGALPGPFSAHPAIDPATGDMYSVATNRYDGSITIAQVSGNKLVRAMTHQQPPGHMAWIHECCITERFILFPDISMRVDRSGWEREGGSLYRFDPDYRMRFGILPRDFDPTTEIRWVATDRPGAIWHLINAWEERQPDGGTRIVLYGPRYDDYPADVPIHTPEETHAHLSKWVIDADTWELLEDRVLLDWGYERTSFNVDHRGRPNRFCYLLDEQRAGFMGKGTLKYDCLEEKELAYIDYGDQFGGEPLFVPRAGAASEDDGYLMDLLMREHDAELLIVDARSMTEVCRLRLPQRVPFGVHAVWLDRSKIEALDTRERATGRTA